MTKVLYVRADLALEVAFDVGIHIGTLSHSDHSHSYIYIELKPNEKPRFTNIIFPFDKTTWIMTMASFLALSLTLWLTIKRKSLETFGSSFQTMYGIIFQEFYEDGRKKRLTYKLVRILWVLTSLFLTMAFLANLKSSLMKKQYEQRTLTLNEMIDKDMRISASPTFTNYLESIAGRAGVLNSRILCQIKKHDSVLDTNEK